MTSRGTHMRGKATDVVFVGVIALFIVCVSVMVIKMGAIQGERDQARSDRDDATSALYGRETEVSDLKSQLAEARTDRDNQELINSTNLELVGILQRALSICSEGITSDETADICLTLNEAGPVAERANAKLSE